MKRFEEAEAYRHGSGNSRYYADRLRQVAANRETDEKQKKVFKAEEMPWELSPFGKLKHVANESLPVRMKSLDSFILEIPPGSRSGKHRHMAEEFIFVLEGEGYDLHWDVDMELRDRYYYKLPDQPKRFEWKAGDCILVPVNTVHQHFNANPDRPARLISATNRLYRYIGYDDLENLEDAPEFAARGAKNE